MKTNTHVNGEHKGFARTFQDEKLTIGFILPVEGYPSSAAPTMARHAELTRMADELGFAALWARDVPLYDPNFGDTGQGFEAFTYLAYLAANTKNIALSTGSAVITLRHPLHLGKQASTVDQLSGGRLFLGISSGDRPVEYPSFGLEADFETRGERFREAFEMFRNATENDFPVGSYPRYGELRGLTDTFPKPVAGRIPALVTGRSRQDMEWIARHADGWFYYFMGPAQVAELTAMWREVVKRENKEPVFKPFAQGFFFDLDPDPNYAPHSIHSGMRVGRNRMVDYLARLEELGVNHVALNLKASRRPAEEVIQELAEFVLPHFPSHVTDAA
jgi:luciferase-type oxidoreductase